MEKLKVGPKDFFLWAGAMLAFYISVFSFVSLFFAYIDTAFPDALAYNVDPYSSGMRFSIASLIVLYPLFLFLMHIIRKDIRLDSRKADLWARKWALVLIIFIAGFTIAADLITLINYFLGGEITTRFLLKVALILLVAAGGLMHFLADIWGYWNQNPRYARMLGIAVGAVILLAIVSGFLIMGTPGQIRQYRFDDQRVNDLQNIQSNVVNYWQQHAALPAMLTDLHDPLYNERIPSDPQTGKPYTYTIKGPFTFEICATFNAISQTSSPSMPQIPAAALSKGAGADLGSLGWFHREGEECFVRTIDPKRYPPLEKMTTPPTAPNVK